MLICGFAGFSSASRVCGSFERPADILVDDECHARCRKDADEISAHALVEGAESLIAVRKLDTPCDGGIEVSRGVILIARSDNLVRVGEANGY